MLDPISDMLTRIRNAQMAGHKDVLIPASKLKLAIARILERENFIESIKDEKEGNTSNIRIALKYDNLSRTRRIPLISEIRQVSRQGQRIYIQKGEIKKVKRGRGIAIISTSKGVLTGEEARKMGVGGEVICELW